MTSQYLSFIIQFFVSVIISRFFLMPEETGLYSIALAAAMMLAVLQDFGINRYVIAQPEMTPDLIRACNTITWVFALLVAAMIAALAGPIAAFYNDDRLVPLFRIIALGFAINPVSAVSSALLSRDLDFRSIAIINVGSALAIAIVAIGCAALGFSAASLAWGLVAGAITRGVLAQWRRPVSWKMERRFDALKPVLSFGSNAMLLQISGAIGVRSTDLLVGLLLTITAVGLYSRAAGLAGQLHILVLGALGSVFFPALARLYREGRALGHHYERIVAMYGAIVWPAMALLASVSLPLVLFLFGKNWEGAASVLAILALSEILFVTLPMHIDLPILFGRLKTLIVLNVIETCISVVFLIVGARWGLEGVAWSRVAYGFGWICCYAILLRSLIGFRWSAMASIYLRSGIVAALTVVPVILSYEYVAPARDVNIPVLLVAGLSAGAIWLGALSLVRHPARHDIHDLIRSAVDKIRPQKR